MSFLLDRLSRTKSKDAMHSSVYGQAQNDGAFGTTSLSSFEDRVKADQNRQTIRRYSDSQVVNEVGRKEKISSIHERNIDGEACNMAGDEDSRQGVSRYEAARQDVASRSSLGARGSAKHQPAASTNMGMRPLPGTRAASGAGVSSRPPARRNPGIFR